MNIITKKFGKLLCKLGFHQSDTRVHRHQTIPGWGVKLYTCCRCGRVVKEDYWIDPKVYHELNRKPPF